MKFEQLLQVYWSKGFYFAGRMRSFNTTLENLFNDLNGLGKYSLYSFKKRFELGYLKYKIDQNLSSSTLDQKRIFNMYFGQISSVNNDVLELLRYNHIKIYLTKTFRGKAQSLGKPSRGQRTWSNAQTARKSSSLVKYFVSEMRKIYVKKKIIESKNKKIIRKKNKLIFTTKIKKEKIKNNIWF